MIRRITKTLLILTMLIGLAQAAPTVCFGWSLLHPFSSDEKPQTTMVSRSTQKPPSVWEKFTTGTKNFFNKTGETLGLKKKEFQKAPPVVAARPRQIQPRASQSSGMMGWLFPKEEKPKDVKGWLDQTKQVTP